MYTTVGCGSSAAGSISPSWGFNQGRQHGAYTIRDYGRLRSAHSRMSTQIDVRLLPYGLGDLCSSFAELLAFAAAGC